MKNETDYEYHKPMTVEEIAKVYGVSVAKIKEIEKSALEKLRKNYGDKLKDYIDL